MGQRFLIDTNILIEFQAKKLPASGQNFVAQTIDKEFTISIINKIEILGHHSVVKQTRDFVNLANAIELDKNVADKTIELRRSHKIKLPDAIIAATALLSNMTLITRNTLDFQNIKELKMINQWELKH